MATVDSAFHGHTDRLRARESRAGHVEGVDVGLAFDRAVCRPGVRTDYVSTSTVSWRHQVEQKTIPPLDVRGAMYDVGRKLWRTTSTATSTTWTFRSGRPRGDRVSVLPLLQVGYQIDTDIANTVRTSDRCQPPAAGP